MNCTHAKNLTIYLANFLMLYTHIVLQLSSASIDLYHTIDLPIVSPVVILTSTRTKFPEADQFSRKFWSGGTNFPPKILVHGTKIPVTIPPKVSASHYTPTFTATIEHSLLHSSIIGAGTGPAGPAMAGPFSAEVKT